MKETPYKNILKLLARLAVSGIALAIIIRGLDIDGLGQALGQAKWSMVLGVWLFTALGYVIRSYKLRFILGRLDCSLSAAMIFGISAINCFYGLFMPGVFTTTIKWYMLKNGTARGPDVLSGMVYNQITELWVKLLVALAAIMVSNPFTAAGTSAINWLTVLAGAVFVLTALSALLLFSRPAAAAMGMAARAALVPLPDWMQRAGQKTIEQLAVFGRAKWRFHIAAVVFTAAGSSAISVLIYYFAARAANIQLPFAVLIWLPALIYLLGRIPISIANLGIREVTIISLLAGYGVAEPHAFVMSMIIFSAMVFMALVGLICQFWLLFGRQRQSNAKPMQIAR